MPVPDLTEAEIRAILADLKVKAEQRAARGPETDVMLMDYRDEYLTSKLWAKIRRRVLKRDGKVCQTCGGHGATVHHRAYDRDVLEGNADHLLATVCDPCHNIIHYDDEGRKRPEEVVDLVFQGGLRQMAIPEPKIDLRLRRQPTPPGWDRMTSRQRMLWHHRVEVCKWEKKLAQGKAKPEIVQMLRDREAKYIASLQ